MVRLSDLEVVEEIGQHVVVAIQHQRLAEEQRRLAIAESGRSSSSDESGSCMAPSASRTGSAGSSPSPSLREALERGRAGRSGGDPVLLTGESGTGRSWWPRRSTMPAGAPTAPASPSTGALPDTLIESELFGHERGAFNRADRQKPGRFELAAGARSFSTRWASSRRPSRPSCSESSRSTSSSASAAPRRSRPTFAHRRHQPESPQTPWRAAVPRGSLLPAQRVPIHLPPLRERGEDWCSSPRSSSAAWAADGQGGAGLSRDARELLVTYPWPVTSGAPECDRAGV